MNIEKRKLGKTHITTSYPWGLYFRTGHRALCSDGVIRAITSAQTADTFFSVPASVRIKGVTYTGYWSTEEHGWIDGIKTDNFQRVYVFRQHTSGTKRPCPLPEWPTDNAEKNALIDKAL